MFKRPALTVFAATRAIRAGVPAERQPYICGLSAHATTEVQESCAQTGMDSYMTKPLNPEKLRNLVLEQAAKLARLAH